MTSLALDSPAAVAEEATLSALLRCAVREVAGPRGQVWHAGPYVLLRVAGTLLRARAHGGLALRFRGSPEWLEDGCWQPLPADLLVRLVEAELGGGNEEFSAQVGASREAVAALLRARREAVPPADPWLASEQALVFGHPFHPSPKARGGRGEGAGQARTADGGPGADWLAYAPEAHASFPLRLLAVRDDVLAEAGRTAPLDGLGTAPPGYSLLPAHPWQLDLLAAELAEPLADGRLLDLGHGARPAVPTSSVRTVYEPAIDRCLKFSLDVRITNCVRKNSWYELAGAVELTSRLEPVFGRLAEEFPGTRWLPEPGYRSAGLGTRLLEGLGVIIRESPWSACRPGVTPVLSGALATPGAAPGEPWTPPGPPEGARAVAGAAAADPVRWWRAYVERVALPVLDAYLTHGVVLEPHLQNVLVGVDAAGMPVEGVFRDLEGTKLVAGRHDLAGLHPRVAGALTYDAAGGWNRVLYCLMVNHLPEIAATLAGTGPERKARVTERELWAAAGEVLAGYAASRGRPRELSDLLAGAPLPAKANLSVRWNRSADRAAGYVPVANPLAVLS
ncbi:IucA/IucC family protein [Planomonospora venezuelensis]|uniref:Siderophore synthetase component n=1 Tax=Planomonospora venezuelensis TaxID=1999 RepID=A0A841CX04_PLAVE|nr:IucA/IucC family protein [Planomonospora venezuelensis]MBB5962942.1 siderophore synthetase component [Planomonospora venezuelensis]GIN04559.1 iron transporter [Planomonospora venezuelensis]